MSNTFNIGDQVKVNLDETFDYTPEIRPATDLATVVGLSEFTILVSFADWDKGHNGNGFADVEYISADKSCWFVTTFDLTKIKSVNPEGFRVGNIVEARSSDWDGTFVGTIVTFRTFGADDISALVSIPGFNGHDGSYSGFKGTLPHGEETGWWVSLEELTLIATKSSDGFKVGDRVANNRIDDEPPVGAKGVIIDTLNDGDDIHLVLVRFDNWDGGHGDDDRNWWARPKYLVNITTSETKEPEQMKLPLEAPKTTTKKTFRKGTQLYMLLQHLASGRTLTRITADHLYRVASLTKRISELRDAGYDITSVRKLDYTGRPYVEYSMRTRKAA